MQTRNVIKSLSCCLGFRPTLGGLTSFYFYKFLLLQILDFLNLTTQQPPPTIATMTDHLTQEDLDMLNHLEQQHHFPSLLQLTSDRPSYNIVEALAKPVFRKALERRGINPPVGQDGTIDLPVGQEISVSGLTAEQFTAIMVMSDFEDKRSREAKLKALGISSQTWNGWMKQKKFKNFFNIKAAENFKDSSHVAQEGLIRAMDKGNVQAIEFYLKVTGQYNDNSQVILNLKAIVAQLMEAISMNVRDPIVINAIQDDFRTILERAGVRTNG
jgi:Helix-turn-helix of insertion element transposase